MGLKIRKTLPSFKRLEKEKLIHCINSEVGQRHSPIITILKFQQDDYEIGQEPPIIDPYQVYDFGEYEDGEPFLTFKSYDELYGWYNSEIPDHEIVRALFQDEPPVESPFTKFTWD